MKTDDWINEMYKSCKKEPEQESTPEVKLSESDMNTLADLMIKKMSNSNFDVETKETEKSKEAENPVELNKEGETPLD